MQFKDFLLIKLPNGKYLLVENKSATALLAREHGYETQVVTVHAQDFLLETVDINQLLCFEFDVPIGNEIDLDEYIVPRRFKRV